MKLGFAKVSIDDYIDEVAPDKVTTRLYSKTKTVQTHLVNIKIKYGGLSRGELIKEATKEYSELEDKRDTFPRKR